MKNTVLAVFGLFFLTLFSVGSFTSCKHGISKQDTLNILSWYTQKSLPNTKAYENLFAGKEITQQQAENQIDSFISNLTRLTDEEQAIRTRSFTMDTKFLREYFSQNCYEVMPNLKMCLAFSNDYITGVTTTPQISMVFLGYDNSGTYIHNANGKFYNQIAACPTVCPPAGTDVSFDDLKISARAMPTPIPSTTCTTITINPSSQIPACPATTREPPRILPK